MNLGLLLAPLLSVLVLRDYGYPGVFFVLTLGYSVTFLYALIAFRHDNHALLKQIRVFHSVEQIWQDHGLRTIYGISFTIEFFYALMIVYMPLHLLNLGITWEQIGVLFTIMLIPFVLIEYPLGILADKRKSERGLLIGSLLIALLATAGLIAVTTPNFLYLAILLFMTRVGIAGVEVLRDSFFYKQIDADDTDVIAFFRTTRSLANIIGTLGLLGLFIFFPFVVFLYLATTMLFLGFILAFFLPVNKRRRGV
jgi:MFS family permease